MITEGEEAGVDRVPRVEKADLCVWPELCRFHCWFLIGCVKECRFWKGLKETYSGLRPSWEDIQ